MRALTLSLALGLALPAAADDSPKAVIEKAVKAHGGADLLAKFTAQRTTHKGTITVSGMESEVTVTSLTQYPGKRKLDGTISLGGMELKVKQLLSGDKLTVTLNGMPFPVKDEQVTSEQDELYAESLTRLVPLLKGDEYTLKAGPEVAVDGDPAVAVVVEHAKHKPVTLAFSKTSGLLVRLGYKGTDEGMEVQKETTYSNHKAVQGVQVPHTEAGTKDGKKDSALTLEKVELLEKADDGEFVLE